ncbi:BSD domain containing protein [Nitzschia inconspicua]|uniref:BSD domain containing protein n=1 Tax=Nitzschia inconspicua TaxID=303405 RepID=A0A9K3PGD3_9STRA|nr:BSD domain containing protein [Nitzschia inconspicua]
MWGTLKKDFGEFVSTVANDATDVLQQLDQGLDGSDVEGRESTMLIDPDTGIPIEYDNNEPTEEESSLSNVQNNKTDMISTNSIPPNPQVATVDEMKAFLMTQDAVFLDVIGTEDDPDATAFLETFDLGTKTEEITNLLETHKDTLEETFSRLIDEVEYAEFWQRFFYRIASDEEKLKITYAHYYDEYVQSMANNKNPTLAAKAALSNVTSFLGGVVHRLVDENNVDDSADEDEEIVDNNNDDDNVPSRFGSSTSAAVKFLTGSVSGVRPPFVLNTAISDDDKEESQDRGDDDDEEEEEEEELGWDDDEEEEDDEEEDRNETVEFKDAEKEKLQEELAQAHEERDMLHKTVTMQSEEIKKLREAIQPEIVAGSNESSQVKILQMQLFEKDAELAALRAQLDDLKNDKDEDENFEAEAATNATAAAREVDRLKEIVAKKDEEIQALKTTQESIQEQNAKAAAATAEMAQELDRMKEEVAAKDREIALLQSSDKTELSFEAEASSAAAKATRELDQLKEVLAKKNNQLLEAEELRVAEVADLRSRLENLQTEKEQVQMSFQSQIDDLKRAQDVFSSEAKSDMENLLIQKDGEIGRLQQSLEEARSALQERATVENIETIRRELVQSQSTIDVLRDQLEHTTTILKEREAEVQALKGPPSPGSTSTGVKVSTDAPSQDNSLAVSEPSVPRKNGGGGDGEDDDGWGDDW